MTEATKQQVRDRASHRCEYCRLQQRHLPRERMAEARRKGVKLGRPEGTGPEAAELLEKHKDIVKHLRAGQSVHDVTKITAKGASTVQRVKAALAVA